MDAEVERARIRRLRSLELLDSSPDAAVDRIAELAATAFDCPIALVDESRQWFKARVGLDARETTRDIAFCHHAIADPEEVLVVADALEDPRFRDNPLVTGHPDIRFYAGAPLRTPDGALGTLCIIDRKPRDLDAPGRKLLSQLAEAVVEVFALRREALRARRAEQLLNLAESLSDSGHWRWAVDDEAVYWSPQVYRIHGLDPETYTPTLASALNAYHPDDVEHVERMLSEVQDSREPRSFELRLRRADGALRRVRGRAMPELSGDGGEVRALFGVFQDVTELVHLQARLAQTEKLATVGTLAAGVAHEINNPLSFVKSNADFLAEELDELMGASPSSRLRQLAEVVDEMRDGTRRIQRIVRDLRIFARQSDGPLEQVDVGRALEVALRLASTELNHNATVVREIMAPLRPILGEESKLVQVAVNLIVNAAQAFSVDEERRGRQESNRITVRAGAADGDRVFFEVEDNGPGMSEEVRAAALDPFFTTKPQGVGTGLGLAICYGIIESFGGMLTLESTLGQGTTARVELPVAR
ncbi:MAG: ATP-binding protein [Myxococcota bacterium]